MAKPIATPVVAQSPAHRKADGAYDYNIKNCYVEKLPSEVGMPERWVARKRFGLASGYSHTAGTGRGIYGWNGNVYYVIGTTLYKNGASLGTLTGSAGTAICNFTEIQGGTPRLIIKDGDEIYTVTTGDTITRIKATVSITSITFSSTTATATVADTSALVTNQAVVIAGATGGDATYYNGTFIITVASSTTFTYTMTGTPGANASGTLTYAPFVPTSLTPGVANLDGYIFVAKDTVDSTNGTLQHARTANNPSIWDLTSVITPSLYPDANTGVGRYLNYIFTTGKYSTEWFYDAGNASGSVLSPVEGATLNWGCPCGNSIAVGGTKLFYICNDNNGNRSVLRLRGLDWQIISPPAIDRDLQQEGDISDCWGYCMRVHGHLFYVINLVSSDKTLVFDDTSEMWYTWSTYDGSTETYFKLHGTAEVNGTVYILHKSNGKVYTCSDTTYQDDSQEIRIKLVSNKHNFGTKKVKVFERLAWNGIRTPASNTINIRYSDDDYASWSTARTMNISKYSPVLSRWGQGIDRAWEITYTANTDFYAESIEHDISLGSHSRGVSA